jgi:hypothetical protein
MGTAYQPKIVTDGLAFMYDTDDGKSYKGEPTVNLAGSIVKNFSSWNGLTGSTEYYTTSTGGQGVKLITTASGGVQWYSFSTIYNIQASTEYTISATVKYIGGTPHPNLLYVRQYDANGQTSESGKFTTANERDLGGGWKRIWRTFTTDATTTHINLQGYEYTTGKTIHIQDLQFEQKGHATQFVNGTRSATEGLIDRTNNATIDLSNASFDSDAQITLDGTDDYIDLGSDVAISPDNQGWTTEYWFNTNSASTVQHFNSAENDEFNANWLAILSSKLAVWNRSPGYWKYGSTQFSSNTWYQAVFICDAGGTNMRFYVNGEAEGGNHVGNVWTASYSSLDVRYIGKYEYNGGHSRYFNGEINAVKIYDRALTASEVLQNFNASRDRFKI